MATLYYLIDKSDEDWDIGDTLRLHRDRELRDKQAETFRARGWDVATGEVDADKLRAATQTRSVKIRLPTGETLMVGGILRALANIGN